MPDLAVSLADVRLRNPVVTAAGTGGYVDELNDVVDLARLGGVVTKSITREVRDGNDPWRIIDLPAGMLNAIGLANVGLDRFLADKLPRARDLDTVVIGSIAGHSVDDYVTVAAAFDQAPELPIVELNVSCPNTADGLQFGESPEALGALLDEVRPALGQTKLFVKLSPNVGDIVRMADAAVNHGADGLTLINTVTAMAIDVETRRPRISVGKGGLSGPAIHPIAVRMVHDVYRGVAKDAGVPITTAAPGRPTIGLRSKRRRARRMRPASRWCSMAIILSAMWRGCLAASAAMRSPATRRRPSSRLTVTRSARRSPPRGAAVWRWMVSTLT